MDRTNDAADPEALAALCRTLEARTGIAAIAVHATAPGARRRGFATAAYAALRVGAAVPHDGRLAGGRAAASNGPLRIAPERLGLAAGFCLVQPIGDDAAEAPLGFLAVAARRPRRVGSRLRTALRDAAEIAAPLLRRASAPEATPGERPGKRVDPLSGVPGQPPDVPRGAPRDASPDAPATGAGAKQGGGEPAVLSGAILPRAEAHALIGALLRTRGRLGPLAFLLIDVDRFRAINDALGAAAGDAVLAVTGSRLEACLRAPDRLIRLEGDRFLVVSALGAGDIRRLAARLLAAVAQPLDLGVHRVAMQASIGIVIADPSEPAAARLLMQADSALHRAKAAGGGRAEIHEPGLHAALLERSRLELDLRHALANGELGLVYQPYIEVSTGRTSGLEALLRWRHPSRGAIPPATFIPLAEASGLILPIGMWALTTACRAATSWPAEATLAVNISALQFHEADFVARVDAALAETGFPAERLELEITETVLMRDSPDTTDRLRALIARGIRIALDDFGTGYSALAYLGRLPHHRIKLDKSFVHDLGRPATAGLIRAIIALARAGGIAVTAEGVERLDQLQAVTALGFTHAQGFATGAPAREPGPFRREPAAASPA